VNARHHLGVTAPGACPPDPSPFVDPSLTFGLSSSAADVAPGASADSPVPLLDDEYPVDVLDVAAPPPPSFAGPCSRHPAMVISPIAATLIQSIRLRMAFSPCPLRHVSTQAWRQNDGVCRKRDTMFRS